MARAAAPFANDGRVIFLREDAAPYINVSGNVGLAVGIPLHASQQKQQARIGTEHAARGIGGVFFAAERFIVAAQALAIR